MDVGVIVLSVDMPKSRQQKKAVISLGEISLGHFVGRNFAGSFRLEVVTSCVVQMQQ